MQQLNLTNMEKVFWPEGLTKFDLVKYYVDMAQVLLPYLKDRPLVMHRFPDGITGDSFYQKECPDYAPPWVETYPIYHNDRGRTVNYILCNNVETLAWLANQACIAMHAWLSRVGSLEHPDIAVIDLDPAAGATFDQVLDIAILVKRALEEFNLTGYPKTSGVSGLHVFIPILPQWTFREVTAAMGYLAEIIAQVYPAKATVEHAVHRRQGKVYLDYLQNSRGRSMAFPYSLRPRPGAPVSTPLTWKEIEDKEIRPADFTLHNIFDRLTRCGDLYNVLLEHPHDLEPVVKLAVEVWN